MSLTWSLHCAGELLWKVELASAVYSPITAYQPMDGQTLVLLGTEKGQLHCLDGRNGEKCWREQLSGPINASGANTVGMSTGAAPAVSSERAWQTCEAGGERLCAEEPCDNREGPDLDPRPFAGRAPSNFASQVWSCINKGDLVLMRCQADRPAVKGEAHVGSPIFSSPVAFDDVVVFGSRDDHLYCVGFE